MTLMGKNVFTKNASISVTTAVMIKAVVTFKEDSSTWRKNTKNSVKPKKNRNI